MLGEVAEEGRLYQCRVSHSETILERNSHSSGKSSLHESLESSLWVPLNRFNEP